MTNVHLPKDDLHREMQTVCTRQLPAEGLPTKHFGHRDNAVPPVESAISGHRAGTVPARSRTLLTPPMFGWTPRCSRGTAIPCADPSNGAAPHAHPGGGGHGLIGLRERIAIYGGEFTAGARDSGSFAVTVSIPLTTRLPA